jgi:hypothetical protein
VDHQGNVYVTGFGSWNVFRITPGGTITEIVDGSLSTVIAHPDGIAVDAVGNVYVAGWSSNNVIKITPGGVITELMDIFSGLAGAADVAVDDSGNVYVTSTMNSKAFKITPGGVITEIIDGNGDGLIPLNEPRAIAVDRHGNVYVAGYASDNVFKVFPGGGAMAILTSFGGGGNVLDGPIDVSVDSSDNVLVVGEHSHNAFRVTVTGFVAQVTQVIDLTGDGAGNTLGKPGGIAASASGKVYVTGSSTDNAFEILCSTPVQTYCTAGTSASGCNAMLASLGTPSATASGGFKLTATSVEGSKDGLFFYASNGTSFQCVVPPTLRGGLRAGSGTVGACDGAISQDLNARWCPTCPKPSHNPGAGCVMQAQLWYRDPLNTSNQTTSLSNAIEFCVSP